MLLATPVTCFISLHLSLLITQLKFISVDRTAMDIRVFLSVALTLLSTQAENCLEEQQCSNCSRTTGYCITDCVPGYFGLKCKSLCSINCIKSECSLTQQGIHECSNGCVPGFYGTQCNIPCTNREGSCTRCPKGCNGTFCHLTSSCVSGCHDSYYGSNCKTCSGRCRSCNRTVGTCNVCHDPYSGQDCQFSCEHCSITNCVQTCAPGLYGHTCSKRCSKKCLPYPPANTNNTVTSNSSNSCTSECHRSSGECFHGCVDGWSGSNCSSQIECNPNCIGCNETGACVDGCLRGYYGDDCKPCSGTCFNHTCKPKNGSCDNGCIHGQYGQFCKLSCSDCPRGACHPRSGKCAGTLPAVDSKYIIIGLLTLLCLGGVLFASCKNVLRKCLSTCRTNQADHYLEAYQPASMYWEITDEDVNLEGQHRDNQANDEQLREVPDRDTDHAAASEGTSEDSLSYSHLARSIPFDDRRTVYHKCIPPAEDITTNN